MQSAGDVSYIKEQPGRFSLWRDTTTSTSVIILAQATTQGYIPQQQLALPAPPPPIYPQLTAPPVLPQIQAPPISFNLDGSFSKVLENIIMPREYGYKSQSYVTDNR